MPTPVGKEHAIHVKNLRLQLLTLAGKLQHHRADEGDLLLSLIQHAEELGVLNKEGKTNVEP